MNRMPTLEELRQRAAQIVANRTSEQRVAAERVVLLATLRRRASEIVANRAGPPESILAPQPPPAPVAAVPQVIGIDLQPIAQVVSECVTVLAEIGQAVREIAAQVRERRSPSPPRSIRVTHSDGSVSVVEQVSNAVGANEEDAPLLPSGDQ